MKIKSLLRFPLLLTVSLICFAHCGNAQIITTIAGNGTLGYSGDNGPATAALLYSASYAVPDKKGNVYISDGNNVIRKIDQSGIIHNYGGNGSAGYGGDGIPATDSKLNDPNGLALDDTGNLFIADLNNVRIRKIDTTGIITTVAGTGAVGYSGDGIAATLSKLAEPADVAIDSMGNLYIADYGNSRIRKVTSGSISTIAGTGTPGYSGDGLPATAAQIYTPNGVAVDGAGNIYIAELNNVRKVNTLGIITTFAGSSGGIGGYGGDGGPATAALLRPYDVATDNCGNVYITDNNRVRKINPSGIITTIAGTGATGYSGDGFVATAALMDGPVGIRLDALMNIYFADANNNVIRKISTANHPPAFAAGHTQSITVCKDTTAVSINTLLAIADIDTLQTETWSTLSGPAHGAVVAAYTATSTGSGITPAGLSYTPATGYAGNDSFKIKISDCGNATDSTTIYVTVVNCGALGIGNPAAQAMLHVSPNPSDGSFTVNLSSPIQEKTNLVITNMIGQMVTVQETTTNAPAAIQLRVPPGIYFLNAATKEGRYNAKVIVGK
jgi:type IX secretion system substrate protein/Big-like domain-containing protein/NHL repeat-containing protein